MPPSNNFESSAEHLRAIRPPNWFAAFPNSKPLRDCVERTMWMPQARPCFASIMNISIVRSFWVPSKRTWNSSIITKIRGIFWGATLLYALISLHKSFLNSAYRSFRNLSRCSKTLTPNSVLASVATSFTLASFSSPYCLNSTPSLKSKR